MMSLLLPSTAPAGTAGRPPRPADFTAAGDPDEALVLAHCRAFESLSARSACCGPAAMAGYFFGRGAGGLGTAGAAAPLHDLADPTEPTEGPAAAAVPGPPARCPRQPLRLVLQRVHVLNPGEAPQLADLWIDDGHIAALRAPGSPVPEGFAVLADSAGRWVMPGLIDMHAHLPGNNVLRLMPHFLHLFVMHGVTGLREAGDVDGSGWPLARAMQDQPDVVAPRIAASFAFVGRPPFRWRNSLAYHGPEDAPRIVEHLVAAGACCMKLYENLGADDIQVLQAHAALAGLGVLGHVPTALAIEQARLDDAQHFFGVPPPQSLRRDHVLSRTADWHAVDDRRLEAVARACERLGLANTPTLSVTRGLLAYRDADKARAQLRGLLPSFFGEVIWNPRSGLPAYRHLGAADFAALDDALDKKQRLVRELHARGCRLHAGTDTMQPYCVPGWSLHRELEAFAAAGIAPSQVLRMATVDAARQLGWSRSGRVAAGYRADLLVLAGDPSHDLGALATLEQVIMGQQVHRVADLQQALQADLARREQGFARIASRVLSHLAMRRAARHFTG